MTAANSAMGFPQLYQRNKPLERHTTCLVSLPKNNPNCCHPTKKSTKRCDSVSENIPAKDNVKSKLHLNGQDSNGDYSQH